MIVVTLLVLTMTMTHIFIDFIINIFKDDYYDDEASHHHHHLAIVGNLL